MSGPDFRELVGEDVPGAERERLRHVHDLLVAAGPPPELSPALEHPPEVGGGRVVSLARRRRGAVLLLAAAIAAAVFGVGFLTGAVTHRSGSETIGLPISMHGTHAAPNAQASIRFEQIDAAGNWPMRLTVQGLPKLPDGGYYELYVTRDGRIAGSCGTFKVAGGDRTVVRLNAPYDLRRINGWIVTRHLPGRPDQASRPLLTT